MLLHKPVGATSFSLVQALQRQLDASPGKAWKLCHAGALDPFASGLLPVLVGSATRLFERVHELPKTYRATVRWGVETDSGDLHGREVRRAEASALTPERLAEALAPFLGWTEQVPPPTSNKRVDGERAWRKAQRGEAVELPPSRVFLGSARWLSHALPDASELELTCRGGFFVRSLARDLGRALGCGAHLGALVRTRIGPWALPVEGERLDLSGVAAWPWWPTLTLDDATWGLLRGGRTPLVVHANRRPPAWPWPEGFPPPAPCVLALHQGRLVALLEPVPGGFGVATLLLPPL